MATKMQAAVVEAFGAPLVLRELDIPAPGPGQVLVKTEACGVCHADLHAACNDWPVKPTPPFTPGHEGIGLVVALGTGGTGIAEGDRVGVPWLYSACGHCLSAWETVCAQAEFGGYTRNGGCAEYILADPSYVARVPAGLTVREAAQLICAGITSYEDLKVAEARPGEWVAISGIGGLGHLAVQYAEAMGLQVCAVDLDDGKLAHTTRLGANAVVNASAGDPAEAVKAATGGGAHGAPRRPQLQPGWQRLRGAYVRGRAKLRSWPLRGQPTKPVSPDGLRQQAGGRRRPTPARGNGHGAGRGPCLHHRPARYRARALTHRRREQRADG